ncbi:MAG TPA: hypothetical protein VKX17_28265 [Planctomycetota bacterium]|nr:hypothetical protein [Planctomycetota bacterium]
MKSATVEEVGTHFDQYLKASEDAPVVFTRKGKRVAILVGGNQDDIERLAMAYSPKLRAILDEANAQIDAGQGIPEDRFWAEVDAMYKTPKNQKRAKKSN